MVLEIIIKHQSEKQLSQQVGKLVYKFIKCFTSKINTARLKAFKIFIVK